MVNQKKNKRRDYFFKSNQDELEFDFIYDKKPFVLFLGAGVNCSLSKNLDWTAMLNSLLETAISMLAVSEDINTSEKDEILKFLNGKDSGSSFNSYSKAAIIKRVLGNEYISLLQSYLYSNCNKKKISEAIINNSDIHLLITVAKLILKCDNIKAVVTYNYDNFLGVAIRLLQEQEKDIYFPKNPIDIYRTIQKLSPSDNDFPIYHVHGFIPPAHLPEIAGAENVVLAYDEYFSNMMESFSWQTSTQLYYLNNYNVLFLGASLNDWNMLRALSNSKRYSNAVNRYAVFKYEFMAKQDEQKVSIPPNSKEIFLNRLKASFLDDVGIKSVFTNRHIEANIFINKLIKNYGTE